MQTKRKSQRRQHGGLNADVAVPGESDVRREIRIQRHCAQRLNSPDPAVNESKHEAEKRCADDDSRYTKVDVEPSHQGRWRPSDDRRIPPAKETCHPEVGGFRSAKNVEWKHCPQI